MKLRRKKMGSSYTKDGKCIYNSHIPDEEMKQIELTKTDIIYLAVLTERIGELEEKVRKIYAGEK